jgi:oligopeptidase B
MADPAPGGVSPGAPVVAAPVEGPSPPVARRIPRTDILHGEERRDDYFWLRRKDDPEVIAYLQAENAYTGAVMKPTEAFQEALYREILGRIKEDDQSVPYRKGATSTTPAPRRASSTRSCAGRRPAWKPRRR